MFDADEYVLESLFILITSWKPSRETEKDWDKDLAEDVKGECEEKYGKVLAIKVERDSQVKAFQRHTFIAHIILQGEIYVKFDSVESAKKAVQALNGRWFGGRQVSAVFISDAIMQAHQWLAVTTTKIDIASCTIHH